MMNNTIRRVINLYGKRQVKRKQLAFWREVEQLFELAGLGDTERLEEEPFIIKLCVEINLITEQLREMLQVCPICKSVAYTVEVEEDETETCECAKCGCHWARPWEMI